MTPEITIPPPRPVQLHVGPGHLFVLLEPYEYRWEWEGLIQRITVAENFRHDMASVPRIFWSLISPLDLDAAAVVHDWIYHWQGALPPDSHQIWLPSSVEPGGFWVDALARADGGPHRIAWSRYDADRIFARHMREAGVPKWRRRAAYRAVRLGGWTNWRQF